MENFTIHIFKYGETQIVSKDLNEKTKTILLNTSKTLIDKVFSKKPKNSQATIDAYHVIHFFNYQEVRWIQADKNTFTIKNDESLKPFIDALITELENLKDTIPA